MKTDKGFMKKVAVAVVLLLFVAGGVLIIKKKRQQLKNTPLPERAPVSVEVARPRAGVFPITRRYLGTIRAKVTSSISPRITGRIFEVRVREGARVKKGQLLALIDDRQVRDRIRELKARLIAARSALNTQEAIFERDEKLFRNKAISREQLDRSRTARDLARAEVASLGSALSSAKTDLSYVRLTAPMDGVITRRYQDPGDLALAGKPVVEMEAPEEGYYVAIKVPQAEFPLLRKGAKVIVEKDRFSPADNVKKGVMELSISRLHPAVTTGTLAEIEADTPRPPFGLPTGATVSVRVETGKCRGIQVPARALLENVRSSFVFSVDKGDKVHVHRVKVLNRGPDYAIIREGDIPDESRIIVAQESALLRLHEGQKVMPVQKEEGRP